jgi:exodeoxyribonuclease VII large subunit
VVPDELALRAHLDGLLESVRADCAQALAVGSHRLEAVDLPAALRSGVTTAVERLDRAAGRLQLVDLRRRLADASQRLTSVDWRSPLPRRLAALDGDIAGRRRTLDALDPTRVLSRGYAIVRTADGSVVRNPAQVIAGDELDVAVAQGHIHAAVTDHDSDDPR